MFLCSQCIDELHTVGDQNRTAYREMPHRLLQGALVGLGITAVASVVWGVLIALLPKVAMWFVFALLIGLVKAMDWQKTKRSIWSMAIIALYTLGGTVISIYTALVWRGFKKSNALSLELFAKLWQAMWEKPMLLNNTLTLSAFAIFYVAITILPKQKQALSQYFNPEIEIIKR